MNRNRDAAQKLFEIAERQQGYFTYKQALSAGYYRRAAHFYTKTGEWLREARGIYHLAKFPIADQPDLVIWSLWSSDRKGRVQGAYSHQTALSLYELTDVNPAKIHMTVPRPFRKGAALPKVLVLHRAEFPKSDIRWHNGYWVTTPVRTMRDMLESGAMHPQDIKSGLRQAVGKGIITPGEADKIEFPKDM